MLSEDQKTWVLSRKGKELYTGARQLLQSGRIDNDTYKEMLELWIDDKEAIQAKNTDIYQQHD